MMRPRLTFSAQAKPGSRLRIAFATGCGAKDTSRRRLQKTLRNK